MKTFNFFFIMLLMVCATPSLLLAQDSELQARSEFMTAEAQYGNGNFQEAINHLNKTKKLLNNTNPRIQHLLVKSLFGLDKYEEAKYEIEKYFEITAESDINYPEMLYVSNLLRENIKKQKERDQIWEITKRQNTADAYNQFLANYPESPYTKEAKAMARMYFLEAEIPRLNSLNIELKRKIKKRKLKGVWKILLGVGGIVSAPFAPEVKNVDGEPVYDVLTIGGLGMFFWGTGQTIFGGGKYKREYKSNKRRIKFYEVELKNYENKIPVNLSLNASSNKVGLVLNF